MGSMARDHIYISGLRTLARIGVLPHERESDQPLQIDLDLEVDLSEAGITDALDDTANYGAIAEAVVDVARLSEDLLLERLVARIAERVLQFPHVEVANVTLTKLRPPIPEDLDSTAVRITRTRVDMKVPGRHRAIIALGSKQTLSAAPTIRARISTWSLSSTQILIPTRSCDDFCQSKLRHNVFALCGGVPERSISTCSSTTIFSWRAMISPSRTHGLPSADSCSSHLVKWHQSSAQTIGATDFRHTVCIRVVHSQV
jgi:dihydroneopterin aldolase